MDEFDLVRIRKLVSNFNEPRIRKIIAENKQAILDFLNSNKQSLLEMKKDTPEYYDADEYKEVNQYISIISNIAAPSAAELKEVEQAQQEAPKLKAIASKVKQKPAAKPKAAKKPSAAKMTTGRNSAAKLSGNAKSLSTAIVAIEGSKKVNEIVRIKKMDLAQPTVVAVPAEKVKQTKSTVQRLSPEQRFELEMKKLQTHNRQLDIKEESLKIERAKLEVSRQEEDRRAKKDADSLTRFNTSSKIMADKMSIAERSEKRKYTFLKSDTGQKYTQDKNKTLRVKENARARAAKARREAAEIRRDVAMAQIADRQRRDAERQQRNREKEAQRAKENRGKAFINFLERGSPDLAFAAKLIAGMGNIGAKSPKAESGGGGGFLGGLLGGAGGALGMGAMGWAKGKFGLGSFRDKVASENPKYFDPNKKNNVGGGNTLSNSAKTVGKSALANLTKGIPLLGGLAAGAIEYNSSGDIGKSGAVGAGTLAGAALGAAAGSVLGPGGTLIGGIIGAVAGEQGMKALYNKFMGTSDEVVSKQAFSGSTSGRTVLPHSFPSSTPRSPQSSSQKARPLPSNKKSAGASGSWGGASSGATGSWDENSSSQDIASMITSVANQYGIPPEHLMAIAQMESGLNPNAVSPTGATGLFQFTKGTAKQYGLTDRSDPLQNTIAAAKLYNDNKAALEKSGEKATLDNIYLAHQQGAGGASQLLKVSRGEGSLSGEVKKNMSLNVGKNAGGANDQQKAMGFINANKNALSSAMSKSQTLVAAQNQMDSTSKAKSNAPAQVAVVNGGSSNVNNVNNTTVINKPDTDPTIMKTSSFGLFPARVLL